MSVFVANPGQDPQQPFECPVCQRGFTRRENLKRHAALHSPGPRVNNFPCEFCHANFSRLDLRQRHVKNKHPDRVHKPYSRKHRRPSQVREHWELESTSPESDSSLDPVLEFPAAYDLAIGRDDTVQQTTEVEFFMPDECDISPVGDQLKGVQTPRPSDHQAGWLPSGPQLSRGYGLYFSHIAPYIPFIHEPTFDGSQIPQHLSLSMLSLAYQHGEDPDAGQTPESGTELSLRCFEQARECIASPIKPSNNLMHNLSIVQSLLMLEICAMLYICGEASTAGSEIHHRMVSFTRMAGLMQLNEPETAQTEDLDSLWREFVRSESLKRTLLAAHQIDALWYQFLSVPRLLSHLEIKCEMPCPADFWNAPSSQQWAHRQLLLGRSHSKLEYGEAIRRFLAPDADLVSLPSFDPYGVSNIAHFLLSSTRELSGWAIMTGRLSLERFDPLRSSLRALEPFVRPSSGTVQVAASCQAAWEMAMIELQVWWPSHVLGSVLGSMDAFVEHATLVAASAEFCSEWDTAQAIRPHIEWFLCYLDSRDAEPAEPPWVILYAYKAFLIAWKLLAHRLPEVMQTVGVEAGDRQGAMAWAKDAFQRRKQCKLVRLINKCLDDLRDQDGELSGVNEM